MADDSQQIGQDEIEELLKQAQGASAGPTPPAIPGEPIGQGGVEGLLSSGPSPVATDLPPASPPEGTVGDASRSDDIQYLLTQAEQALASVDNPNDSTPGAAELFRLKELNGTAANPETATLELLRGIELGVRIELGRTNMYLEDVLKLNRGSVVPLDKLAGDPVDVFVNGRLVARGEILVLNDSFCVRVAELIAGDEHNK